MPASPEIKADDEEKFYQLILSLQDFLFSRQLHLRTISVDRRTFPDMKHVFGEPVYDEGEEIIPARVATDFGPVRIEEVT